MASEMMEPQGVIARLTKDGRMFIANMPDGPRSWSSTHGWNSERLRLEDLGLIKRNNKDNWRPETVPTELGLAVRATLSASKDLDHAG